MFRFTTKAFSLLLPRDVSRRSLHNTSYIALGSSGSSGGNKKSITSRDTRLAGRLRFYKQVGVESVAAPETITDASSTSATDVKNPISAGVDGTSSASGVHHPPSAASNSSFAEMLHPRAPGSENVTSNLHNIEWFGVTLDGRFISTPMGRRLAVPSEMLAYMIAAEWDAQGDRLQPANMPLMTLACTALDQVAHHPDGYREQCLRFLPTDTTCYWADPTEDRVLHRRQQESWKELHEYVSDSFGHAPAFAMGATEAMLMSRKRGDAKPFTGLPHPPTLVEKATDWTNTLDAWHLTSLHSLTSQAKSFFVAWAMMQPNSPLSGSMEKAIDASRVEEEFQISAWGLVEGGHDYDRLNCSIQLHSARLFFKTIELANNLRD